MALRYALLGLLRQQSDYGYRLKRRFDERAGEAWQLNVGQVYQTLHALVHAGLVAEVVRRPDGHLPARRLFEITPRGAQALDRWLSRPPARPRPVRDELLLRLVAAQPGHRADLVAQVIEQQNQYAERLQHVRREQALLSAQPVPSGPLRELGLEAELLHTEAQLRWLARCRELLSGARAGGPQVGPARPPLHPAEEGPP